MASDQAKRPSTVVRAGSISAQFGRDIDRSAHGPPDLLDVDALGECLVDRAAAELRQHEIVRKRGGVSRSELLPHPVPEIC